MGEPIVRARLTLREVEVRQAGRRSQMRETSAVEVAAAGQGYMPQSE